MKNLKKRLQNGEILHGCWLNLGSSLTAEIVGLSGFDWVLTVSYTHLDVYKRQVGGRHVFVTRYRDERTL